MATSTGPHPTSPSKTPSRTRKRNVTAPVTWRGGKPPVIDLTSDGEDEVVTKSPKKRKTAVSRKREDEDKDKDEEKRLKMFRNRPPQSYLQKLNRALEQR